MRSTCSPACASREPRAALRAYPHQLSGGQRQRVAIASAIAARPKLLIADEPTSALDMIVQAEIVALLDALVREDGMTLLFITHDIALASGFADRIAVFRDARLVESGPTADVLARPREAYTQAPHRQPYRPRHAAADRGGRGMSAPLLAATDISKTFASSGRRVAALDRASITRRARRNARPRRPVGQRQVDACPHPAAPRRAGRRPHRFRRRRSACRSGARALRAVRKRIQMVFQDPLAAFNPRATVAGALADPLRIHGLADRARAACGNRPPARARRPRRRPRLPRHP